MDRRIVEFGERVAEQDMLTMRAARLSGLASIRSGRSQRLLVPGKCPAGGELQAAAAMFPGADERREHGDGAGCGAAIFRALDAVVHADHRGPGRGVFAGQPHDVFVGACRSSAETRSGVYSAAARLQLLEAMVCAAT